MVFGLTRNIQCSLRTQICSVCLRTVMGAALNPFRWWVKNKFPYFFFFSTLLRDKKKRAPPAPFQIRIRTALRNPCSFSVSQWEQRKCRVLPLKYFMPIEQVRMLIKQPLRALEINVKNSSHVKA